MSRAALVWMVLAGLGCAPGCGPTNPAPDVLGRDDYVAACARVQACVSDTSHVPTLTECAALGATPLARAPFTSAGRCIDAAAGDCSAILGCLAAPAAPAACSIDDVPSCLDAAHVLRCLGGATYVEACGAGTSCIAANEASGMAGCGRQACGETFVPTCDGEQILRCEAGVLVARACAEGARCAPGAAAGDPASCVGEGGSCSSATCDGRDLLACEGDHVARRDCAADGVDGTCALSALSSNDAQCIGAGVSCDSAFVDRCNGARLEYCQDGHIVGIDCASLGFAACALGDVGQDVPSHCATAGGGT